jgi:hypothetical protein
MGTSYFKLGLSTLTLTAVLYILYAYLTARADSERMARYVRAGV